MRRQIKQELDPAGLASVLGLLGQYGVSMMLYQTDLIHNGVLCLDDIAIDLNPFTYQISGSHSLQGAIVLAIKCAFSQPVGQQGKN